MKPNKVKLTCVIFYLTSALAVDVISPFGVKMCENKCDSSKCEKVKYDQSDLLCCITNQQQPSLNYQEDFTKACKLGNADVVKCFLSLGLVYMNMNISGRTPIMIAARKGHKAVCDYLLSLDCDLGLKDSAGSTVLHNACLGGNVEIVRVLIEDKNIDKEQRDDGGQTPVLVAASLGKLEVFTYLMEQGCNISSSDTYGRNALHLASRIGNMEIVSLLIPQIDTQCTTELNYTPAKFAAMRGHADVFEYIVKKTQNLQTSEMISSLRLACIYDSINVAMIIIDVLNISIESKLDSKGHTPFLMAAKHKSLKVLRYLSSRCNTSATDKFGNTALHLAVASRKIGVVKQLLDTYGLDINSKNRDKDTAIGKAASSGNKDMFELLLEKGADIQVNDYLGNNLLFVASAGGNVDIVRTIISEAKFDVNSRGYQRRTAILEAATHGHYDVFMELRANGASLDVVDAVKNTIFHCACEGGNLDIVKLLVNEGKLNYKINTVFETPLDLANQRIKFYLKEHLRQLLRNWKPLK